MRTGEGESGEVMTAKMRVSEVRASGTLPEI